MANDLLQETAHRAASDLEAAIRADPDIYELWERLTPLGRNEFICWVDDAKQPATRLRRVRQTEETLESKKRPCCLVGRIHRADKAPSAWQQAVLMDPRGARGR